MLDPSLWDVFKKQLVWSVVPALLLLFLVLRPAYAPDGGHTRSSDTVVLCGNVFALRSGYIAFDYGGNRHSGWQPSWAYVNVRSIAPDASMPTHLGDLISDFGDRATIESLSGGDASLVPVTATCAIQVFASEEFQQSAYPRPDDWNVELINGELGPDDG